MNDCARYWAYSDYLPIDEVVTYWCEKSGYPAEHCKAGKRAAIVKACNENIVKFGRSDNRIFSDPVDVLLGRGILTIERKSFDAWVTENFEDESPLPERPIGRRERDSLLNIIGGLLELLQDQRPTKADTSNQAKIIEALVGAYKDKNGISERNLQGKFAEANRSLAQS
jgi:hypothetical protein